MAKTKPLFSILIPTYNREKYIQESVKSVLSQTLQDFEIVISDNASTDNTWKTVQNLAKKDKKIRIYRQKKNIGSGNNINSLLTKPKGKYAIVLFDDDIIEKSFLEEANNIFKTNDVDYIYVNSYWIDKNSKIIHKNKKKLYPKKIIERYGLLKDKYSFGICACAFKNTGKVRLSDPSLGNDIIFALEHSLNGTGYYCHKNLFYYRFHSGNESQYTDLFERSVPAFDGLKKIYNKLNPKLKKKMEIGILNHMYLTFLMSVFYQSLRKLNFKMFRSRLSLLRKKTGFFKIRLAGVLKFINKMGNLILSTIARFRFR